MENEFYKIFKRIIRECNYTNTYKMAWAKAIVELAVENEKNDEVIIITLNDVAEKFLKYYWNQTIFFNLVQGSNLIEIPVIVQIVKVLIEKYYEFNILRKPDRFERIEEILKSDLTSDYNECIKCIVKTLKADVSWRFTYIDGINHEEVYKYKKGGNELYILKENLDILKENSEDLFDLINYRWGLILETFNSSPRINKKVKIIDDINIKRNSLLKYREYLDIENKDKRCFICGEKIEEDELSIDHVIPWSYLYSDDLWNLVYVHKSCNSSKSNVIPTRKTIERLKTRNRDLLAKLKERNIKGKYVDELELAIKRDYVNKFWIGCKS